MISRGMGKVLRITSIREIQMESTVRYPPSRQ